MKFFFFRVDVFFIFLNCFYFYFFPVSFALCMEHRQGHPFKSSFFFFLFPLVSRYSFLSFFFLAQLLLQSDVTFGCV